jgi:UDP-N-acetylglucosamine/UDP-N-acetylgalactosamine diphosphorylase
MENAMWKQRVLEYLAKLDQLHLAAGIDELSSKELEIFFLQLKNFDAETLKKQREILSHPLRVSSAVEPLSQFDLSGSREDIQRGYKSISEGKVGCLILAGGQGSRLGTQNPKGLFPVSLVKGKSLFQLFLEKVAAASKWAQNPLSLAIMTSSQNHNSTVSFLEQHQFFGANRECIDIFLQGTLPFLDDQGNWLLESPGVLVEGADGNGMALVNFFQSGIWEKWKQKGIEYLNVILIDNPLADPFDAELIGYHLRSDAEVTIKSIFREHPQEKVGVIGLRQKKIEVVEYSELSPQEKIACNPDGSLRWKVANISLFCFSMNFIRKVVELPQFSLPWHILQRKTLTFFNTSKGYCKDTTMAWKYETFIFDILKFADRIKVLVYPREQVFAPLKNASGEASLESVQNALLASDRRKYYEVTEVMPPYKKFELDQAFYYPTSELLRRWKGKPLPDAGYIDPEF